MTDIADHATPLAAEQPPSPLPLGQVGPSLAELIPLMPEAGHVFLNVAIARWTLAVEQAQSEQLRQQLAVARGALLQAGIDPLTLQPVADAHD